MPIIPHKSYLTTTAVILVVLFLMLIFIIPSLYLKGVCDKIVASVVTIDNAVLNESWDTAEKEIFSVKETLEANEKYLYMFLNHKDISDVMISVRACSELIKVREQGQIICEIQSILVKIDMIRSVEIFNISNLF